MSFLKRLVDLLAPRLPHRGRRDRLGTLRKDVARGLRPYLIAALALVLLHLVLRWEDVAPPSAADSSSTERTPSCSSWPSSACSSS